MPAAEEAADPRAVAGPQTDPAVDAKQIQFVDSLRNPQNAVAVARRARGNRRSSAASRRSTRDPVRLQSADISKASMPAAQELGKALSNASLKGSTFVVWPYRCGRQRALQPGNCRSVAPTPSSASSPRNTASTAPISSPSATARTSEGCERAVDPINARSGRQHGHRRPPRSNVRSEASDFQPAQVARLGRIAASYPALEQHRAGQTCPSNIPQTPP